MNFRLMLFRYRFIFINPIKKFNLNSPRNSSTVSIPIDPCTGCEIPCTKHASCPPEILQKIDQSDMTNSVEKYRRHLCIGQSISPSQWPKKIKNLPGDYIKELTRIFEQRKEAIGYSIKLTAASIPSRTNSEQTADWYLFPDQLKLNNVHIKHIEKIVEKLFLNDQSILQTKIIEEYNHLSEFNGEIQCERLNGLWILVCCHHQRDERCGIIGPILVDEIEKHVRKTNQIEHIHCLQISHIGGHRFAGNIIIYPSGTWYGRVLPCHIPLLIDAYTSSSEDLKAKLKPVLRGCLDTRS